MSDQSIEVSSLYEIDGDSVTELYLLLECNGIPREQDRERVRRAMHVAGILDRNDTFAGLTLMGLAWLKMLTDTPFPEVRFVDPRRESKENVDDSSNISREVGEAIREYLVASEFESRTSEGMAEAAFARLGELGVINGQYYGAFMAMKAEKEKQG